VTGLTHIRMVRSTGIGRCFLLFELLTACAGLAPLFAQPERDQAGTQVPAPDTVATLHFFVVDHDGRPVNDLRKEDIAIIEDKTPREILDLTPDSTTPLIVGVAVDVSGSTRLWQHRKEFLQTLNQSLDENIRGGDTAYLVAIGDDTKVFADLTHKKEVLDSGFRKLESWPLRGSTALYDGIYTLSQSRLKEIPGRSVLLVLSDFEDNASRKTIDKVIAEAQQNGLTVFPVLPSAQTAGGGTRVAHRALLDARKFAEQTGGATYVFETAQDLAKDLESIRLQLRNSYTVHYQFTGSLKSGKSVSVKVRVNRKGMNVTAARSRRASPK
jgi:VWFA-related protein